MRQLRQECYRLRRLQIHELRAMLYRLLRAWFLATPDLEARMTIATQDQEQHRAEVVEALAKANTHAKRQQYVIEKFAADRPTKWTTAHRYLNDLLDEYESCG